MTQHYRNCKSKSSMSVLNRSTSKNAQDNTNNKYQAIYMEQFRPIKSLSNAVFFHLYLTSLVPREVFPQ